MSRPPGKTRSTETCLTGLIGSMESQQKLRERYGYLWKSCECFVIVSLIKIFLQLQFFMFLRDGRLWRGLASCSSHTCFCSHQKRTKGRKYLCQFEIISPFHFFIGKSKDSGCKLGKSQAGRGTESGLRND